VKLKSKDTVLSISNATELASGVIYQLLGNEVSNTLDGSFINKETLSNIITLRMQARFSKYNKTKKV
jgi:hypothetical protein